MSDTPASYAAAYAAGAAEMREQMTAALLKMAAFLREHRLSEKTDDMAADREHLAARLSAIPLPPFDREAAEEKMARAIARGRWPCSVAPGKSCGGSLLCTCEQAARDALAALIGER